MNRQAREQLKETRKFERDFNTENGQDFQDSEMQSVYNKYMHYIAKNGHFGNKKAGKLAIEVLEKFCSLYVNKTDGECIKIEMTNEYQR